MLETRDHYSSNWSAINVTYSRMADSMRLQGFRGGGAFLSEKLHQGLVTLRHPDYIAQLYHGTLLTLAVIALGILINTQGSTFLSDSKVSSCSCICCVILESCYG